MFVHSLNVYNLGLPLTAYRLPLTADFQAKEKREPSLVALAESSNFVASCN